MDKKILIIIASVALLAGIGMSVYFIFYSKQASYYEAKHTEQTKHVEIIPKFPNVKPSTGSNVKYS